VESEKYIQSFSLEPDGKRSLVRHIHKWKENIKMDLEINLIKQDWRAWNGFFWLSLGYNGRLV
jgi:hypothetical protein